MTADSQLEKEGHGRLRQQLLFPPPRRIAAWKEKPSKITLKNCDKDPGTVALHNSYFLAGALVGKDSVFFKRLGTGSLTMLQWDMGNKNWSCFSFSFLLLFSGATRDSRQTWKDWELSVIRCMMWNSQIIKILLYWGKNKENRIWLFAVCRQNNSPSVTHSTLE